MSTKPGDDPRSQRARNAFRAALQELLKDKPYQQITITHIAHQSGYSRHTFYNHFQTKDELLDSLIDSILDRYFGGVGPWEAVRRDPDGDVRLGQRFFEAWSPHADIVRLLNSVDIDHLLIRRLRVHFAEYFEQRILPFELPGVSPQLVNYIITLLTYSYAGVLRQWVHDGMREPPEVMGAFMNHFTGRDTATVLARFKDAIR